MDEPERRSTTGYTVDDAITSHTVSDDGRTLVVEMRWPDGKITSGQTGWAAPPSQQVLDDSIRNMQQLMADRMQVPVVATDRVYRLGRRWLIYKSVGAPTWWLPRIQIRRRSVLVGWLRWAFGARRVRPPSPDTGGTP
jgi:hypothetical protein